MVSYQGPPIQCSIALKKNPLERLLFESFPQTISEGYQVRYNDKSGRTTQATYAYYSGGNYSPFRLTLKFVAGLHKGINTGISSLTVNQETLSPTDIVKQSIEDDIVRQEMEAKARWLEALCFPRPDRPRPSAAKQFVVAGTTPRVLITFGRFMTIEGVADNFEETWGPPFDPVSARPGSVEVSLGIKRLGTFYIDWYDVSQKAVKRSPEQFGTGATGIFEEAQLQTPAAGAPISAGFVPSPGGIGFSPVP